MGNFLYIILDGLLGALIIVLIANAILSWLVAFDVINLRNRFAHQIAYTLEMISRPVLRPFQRFIPPLGGMDVTPIIAIIVLSAAPRALLPWLR